MENTIEIELNKVLAELQNFKIFGGGDRLFK